MKAVRGALNEKDAKLFKKAQEKLKMSEHGIITKLAKGVIYSETIKEFLENTKASTLCIIYFAMCYSLVATTLVLI